MRTAGADGRPYAVDFGAVMTMGAALGADSHLLASVLPAFENVVVGSYADDAPEE